MKLSRSVHVSSLLMAASLLLSACGGGQPQPTEAPTKSPQSEATQATAPSPSDTPVAAQTASTASAATTSSGAAQSTQPTQATQPAPTTPAAQPTQAAALQTPTAQATATPQPQVLTGVTGSPEFGAQAFLWWRPEVADRDLGLMRDAGFNWVKQEFAWRDIEGTKGKPDWSIPDRIVDQVKKYNLKLLVRVGAQPQWAGGGFPQNGPPTNMQDFANFVSAMATRYKGRIAAYQVWNEPNLNVAGRSEWGGRAPSPVEYTNMLKLAYGAIKQADPNAIVISAGLSPTSEDDNVAMPDTKFLQGMYQAGAKPYFDMLGAHAAGYKVSPETDPAVVANDPKLNNNDPSPVQAKRIYAFRHAEDLRQIMVQNGDQAKKMAILEFGWTTDPIHLAYKWFAVTRQQQADYLVRAYQYAAANWKPWIGIMSLIYMPNVDWTQDKEEYWWSIMDPSKVDELKLEPAFVELCGYMNQVQGRPRCRFLPPA